MADRGAEPGVGAGREAAEALHHQRVQVSSKRLTGSMCTAERALRVKCVQRHTVAEFVQRDGQRGGGRALLLVHGVADSARLGD